MPDQPDPVGGTAAQVPPTDSGPRAPRTRRELRAAEQAAAASKSKAGRDLPAAIAVGLVLLGAVLVGLFWFPLALLAMVVVLAGLGSWEVARATSHVRTAVPLTPVLLACALLPAAAYFGGLQALGFAYLGSLLLAVLFRIMEGLKGASASIMASVFIISWVPLLLSFAVLLLADEKGRWLIASMLLLVVANDTFGYIVGVLLGRHPMAPKVSPKKSWEGFAGSMLGAMVIGALCAQYLLQMPWWTGLILAVFIVVAATTGDLSESMVKRELGIKDMSNLLPGHGGVMDRLDSVLFSVPLTYLASHLIDWVTTYS
ncbi:Phosphatidate cytidylyltransferase [Glutamicibacter creatinolyticus]|uniref:Phosphatidate cytidylyltransferase n=3 Tax=Micrococcaceae TaxID=1268 RepID=A0A5B7WRL6_9MICC|nr:phosphatidate cytidylyltransferase [Glutamicibacter creatinolyticus]QCY46522.1 Phosphatidate cytidylyltransferase [Glutamicibacter creatinolyticus]